MLLTIMSSIAQEESRSISENVSWGVQRRFEEGKLEKASTAFDDKMVLLQDYISKNAITEKELADGRYSELDKDYREALAEKEKLQEEDAGR